jgi:hypothetical protein
MDWLALSGSPWITPSTLAGSSNNRSAGISVSRPQPTCSRWLPSSRVAESERPTSWVPAGTMKSKKSWSMSPLDTPLVPAMTLVPTSRVKLALWMSPPTPSS